jgi:replicative DNA helicase
MLTAIGMHAMKLGKRVAHYTLELSETYTGLRYDSVLTGIEPNKINENKGIIQSAMSDIEGQLVIKFYPARSITTNTIMAHIQRLQNLGTSPDLILIDYADLMRSSAKADAKHEELQYIHEEIRGMLGELRLPGWTVSQSQRSSTQDEVIEADKIAGSYGKIMTDDAVFSVSRKLSDKVANTARIHCMKNRFGPDGLTFPALMDLGKGTIQIYDENSPEGVKLKQQNQDGETVLKNLMKKKLIDPAHP